MPVAVNRQTGERLILIGGRWMPMGVAKPQSAFDDGPSLGETFRSAFSEAAGPQTVESLGGAARATGILSGNKEAGEAVGSRLDAFADYIRPDGPGGFMPQGIGDVVRNPLQSAAALSGMGAGSMVLPAVTSAGGAAAGSQFGPAGTAIGGAIGALGSSYALNFGENYNTFVELGADDEQAARWAAGLAAPQAVLDSVGLGKVLRPFRGAGLKFLIDAGESIPSNVFARIAKGAGISGAAEATTEMAQAGIQEAGAAAIAPEYKSEGLADRLAINALGGLAAGAPIGGVTGGFSRPVTLPAEIREERESAAPAERAEPVDAFEDLPAAPEWQPIYADPDDEASPVTGYVNPTTEEIRTPEEHLAAIQTPLSGLEPRVPDPAEIRQAARERDEPAPTMPGRAQFAPGEQPKPAPAAPTVGPSGTVAESPEQIAAQTRAYAAGQRGPVFVDGAADRVPVPDGMVAFPSRFGGSYIVRPEEAAQIRAIEATTIDKEAARARILGYQQTKDEAMAGRPMAVQAKDADGNVVAEELVDADNAEALAAASESKRQMAEDIGGLFTIVPPDQAIRARQQETQTAAVTDAFTPDLGALPADMTTRPPVQSLRPDIMGPERAPEKAPDMRPETGISGGPDTGDLRSKVGEVVARNLRARGIAVDDTGGRSAEMVYEAIVTGKFNDALRPDNKGSRLSFTQLTGVSLPKTLSGTKALFKGVPFPMLGEEGAESPTTPSTPPQDARKPEPAPATAPEPEAAPAAALGGEQPIESMAAVAEDGAPTSPRVIVNRVGRDGLTDAERGGPLPPASSAPLTVESFSDKSIIIKGDTKAHKDRIKAVPGAKPLWNRKAGGWVFPKKREAAVREALADLLGGETAAPEREQSPERPVAKGDQVVVASKRSGKVVANGTYMGDDPRTGSAKVASGPGRITMHPWDAFDLTLVRDALSPDNGAAPSAPETPPDAQQAAERIANWLSRRLNKPEKITWQEAQKAADKAFGGTMAQGAYSAQDLANALEFGLNSYILTHTGDSMKLEPELRAKAFEALLAKLPTQTRRSDDKVAFQQFSTPAHYAFAAAYAAGIRPSDTVLEPSAGTGNLAVMAKAEKAGTLIVNEIDSKRAGLLRDLGADRVFTEDAEQLDNILPADVRPTVVLMNPPFSAAGNRGVKKDLMVGARHIDQALARLAPGGRLVAIVGRGMAFGAPTFQKWWKDKRANFNVRANIAVDGEVYRKLGTAFDTRLLVIDNDGPTAGTPRTGEAKSVNDLFDLLEGIANDRPESASSRPAEQSGARPVEEAGGGGEPGAAASPGPAAGGDRPQSGADTGQRPGQVRGGDRPDGDAGSAQPAGSGRGDALPDAGQRPDAGPEAGGPPQPGAVAGGDAVRADDPREAGDEPGRLSAAPDEGRAESSDVAEPAKVAPSKFSDAVFDEYEPSRTPLKGAQKHPAELVESAAMATVSFPKATPTPNLPAKAVTDGRLSAAQIETIALAKRAHAGTLGDGATRRGFFIGDGTGVGKGAQIAGIVMDNWRDGRRKAVWVSKNKKLFEDAIRDWSWVGGDKNDLTELGKTKLGQNVKGGDGILFATYDTLKGNARFMPDGTLAQTKRADAKARVQQIIDWIGDPEFDGVIAFDESHLMGNAVTIRQQGRPASEPAQAALAGLHLQRAFPKARVVYASATGATEVANLSYAERLGLWGEGTSFANVQDFIDKIAAGGIAAMELVARDLKSQGLYTARSISMRGVKYDRMEHRLTEDDLAVYDELATGWQTVLRNVQDALELTGGKKNRLEKQAAIGRFWSSHQRFFNQIIISLQMPTVLRGMKKDLEAGHAVVAQLVNTNEAQQERSIAKSDDEEFLDLDLTPRDMLIDYVKTAFPVQQFQEVVDDEGRKSMVPVFDSQGKPVLNSKAVAMRDALVDRLASVRVPLGPMEYLFQEFGTERVAEVTGRSRRVVWVDGKQKIERRGATANSAETKAFQDGKKDILVFSMAGGTGASYHADLKAKNQKLRRHYLVQAGWRADAAIQGFGRTHRTNQKQPPEYVLATTSIQGQKRFTSTIARRLSQLGAITRGQRQAGEGIFTERDNLESQYAQDAVTSLTNDVIAGKVPDLTLDQYETELGLTDLVDKTGRVNASKFPTVQRFLNRLLSATVERQNRIFDLFQERMDAAIRAAEERGDLDTGLQTINALSAKRVKEAAIYTDPESGAETKYVHIETTVPRRRQTFKDVARRGEGFVINLASGKLWSYGPIRTSTDKQTYRVRNVRTLTGPATEQRVDADEIDNEEKYRKITSKEAEPLWQKAYDEAPDTRKVDYHLITGAILPVFNRLPARGNVYRVQLDDGEQLLGREIPAPELAATLQRFNVGMAKPELTPAEAVAAVMDDGATITLANDWTIRAVTVAGERRMLLTGPNFRYESQLFDAGVFAETHNYTRRYFIPTGSNAAKAMEAVVSGREIVKVDRPRTEQPRFSLRLTDSAATKLPALERDLRARLEKVGIAGKVALRVVDAIRQNVGGGRTVEANAMWLRGAITVALDGADALGSLNHEVIHALRELGMFTGAEWQALERAAKADNDLMERVRSSYANLGLTDAKLLEEVIAEQYRMWADGRSQAGGWMKTAFGKVRRFFQALGQALRGQGFTTADSVFERIESGEVGGRQEFGGGAESAAFALRPYENADDRLMGFRRSGENKGFADTRYPHVQPVRVEWADGDVLEDEIKGTNRAHALERARRNWPTAEKVEAIGPGRRATADEMPRFKLAGLAPGHEFAARDSLRDTLHALDEQTYSLIQNVLRPESRGRIGHMLDKARFYMQDRMIFVRRAQEAVEQHLGRPLRESERAYLQDELLAGRVGEQKFRVQKDFQEPILERMHEAGLTLPEVDDYLYALHAEERNEQIAKVNPDMPDGGSGITTADARKHLREVPAEKRAALEEIAGLVHAMMERRLDTLVETGILAPKQAEAMRATYEHYVPLRGKKADPDEDVVELLRPHTGRGYMGSRRTEKRATGRFSEAPDILGTAFVLADEAIVRGEKNRVGQAILRLATAAPDPRVWTVNPAQSKAYIDKATGQVRYKRQTHYSSEDTMSVRVAGQEYRIQIKDPALLSSIKQIGGTQQNAMVEQIAKVTQALSKLNTMWNPEFVVANASRDIQTALINLGMQADAGGIRKDVVKSWAPAYRGVHRYITTGKADTEWSKHAREFREAGGQTSFNALTDVEGQKKTLEAALGELRGDNRRQAMRALHKLRGIVEPMNDAVDNAVRLGTFVALRNRGVSAPRAASIAKNLTVNFNRRGALGPTFNAFFMFFNAAMQGTAVLANAMRSPQVRKLVGAIAIAGAMQEIIAGLMPPPDDDDEEGFGLNAYDRIPEWVKERNLIIPYGIGAGQYLQIPMPYGYNWFHNLGRLSVAYLRGAPTVEGAPVSLGQTVARMASSFVSAMIPPGLGDGVIPGVPVPSAVAPLVEVAVNQDWTGRQVIPERFPGDTRPDSQVYFNNVSPISREVADFLNSITGGNAFRSGMIDISPESIDHVVAGFTGAAGSQALRAVSSVSRTAGEALGWNEQDPNLSILDVPFVRKVVGYDSPHFNREVTYRRITEVETLKDEFDLAREQGERPERQPLLGLAPMARQLRRQLSEIRKQRQAISDRDDWPVSRKREQMDRLDQRERELMTAFNRRYLKVLD